MVDAGGRTDEPVLGLRDHERPALSDDLLRLTEHHLDLARVALVAGELAGLLGRLEIVEPDDAPLGLRDRLLRDDEDVTVAQLGPLEDERPEIVALPDLRQAADGEDLDRSTPLMRRPACAL